MPSLSHTLGCTLPYPGTKFGAELALQLLFVLVDPARLLLGVCCVLCVCRVCVLAASGG